MEKTLKQVGLWIDHRQVILVSLGSGTETITRIESEVEPHFRPAGGSRSAGLHGPRDVTADGNAERRRHQLHEFYRRVMEALHDADAIYIFGPGVARHELEKEIRATKSFATKIAAVRTFDKMTDRQIAAEVRRFFKEHP